MKIYAVGGQVRDQLMGVASQDRDFVVVGSTPEEMLAKGFQQVGAAFPVYLHPVTGEEYALARTETKTGDGYLGFSCSFGPEVTLEEDLGRRDLTINSIAYDASTGEYIDPYNGRADIKNLTLRHTSAAFSEDPLRVIRLARFYARFYNFGVHQDTVELACKIVESGEMDKLSFERYWAELRKVMVDSTPEIGRFLQALHNFGALEGTAFFQDVFGSWKYGVHQLNALLRLFESGIADIAWTDPDLAVAVLIALFEDNAPLSHAAVPTRVSRLVRNVRQFQMDGDCYAVYNILAGTRALNDSTEALTDFTATLRVMQCDKYATAIEQAQIVTAAVSAEPFMHLNGAEIGAALKVERLAALQTFLGK